MSRLLFTAADIRRIAREQKSDLLVLGPADLITPEAVDLAGEIGVRLVREPAAPEPDRRSAARAGPPAALPPLKVVRRADVVMEPFAEDRAAPGMRVRLKDVVTSGDGSPVAAGYMALDAPASGPGAFPWTLTYDEIDIVLEGELVITRGDETVRGGPGDVLFIPRGSAITFGTPSHARFVYVAFPADWAGGQ